MDEDVDVQDGRARRNRLQRNRQRERVFRMVREHDGAVDAVELASAIGLHVTTVRFHLDALCDEGAIKRTRLNRSGPGRPRTGYVVVEERLDYRTLAEVLAVELGQSRESRGRRAQHAGKRWAAQLAASQDPAEGSPKTAADDALEEAAVRATVAFTRLGFAPELVSATKRSKPSSPDRGSPSEWERTIRLHACPVRDLARSHPEVVCGVHLGLLQGMLTDAAGGRGRQKTARQLSAHLAPFVEPELCVARLARSD